MNRAKGILYAAVSSSTFGVAAVFLALVGRASGCRFRLENKDFRTVFGLSLLRAATSLSLIVAYQHIASGVASTIHLMYPLAVAIAMAVFFSGKRDRPGHSPPSWYP